MVSTAGTDPEYSEDLFRAPLTGAPSWFDRVLGASGALGKEAAADGVGKASADFDLRGPQAGDPPAPVRRSTWAYRLVAILVVAPFAVLVATVMPPVINILLVFTLYPWLIRKIEVLLRRAIVQDQAVAASVMRGGRETADGMARGDGVRPRPDSRDGSGTGSV